jgi:hypothetical protein
MGRSEGAVSEYFVSGRVVDLILGFMLLEWGVFAVLRRGGARAAADFLLALLPGACLLLALRAALERLDWIWIAVFLLAALPAHLTDLWRRWRK